MSLPRRATFVALAARTSAPFAFVFAFAFLLACLLAAGAAAQSTPPPPDDVDELVVTGRRLSPVKLALESAAVSVVTREELARSGAHTLLEALRGELGVNAYAAGGPGAQAALFLRGASGARVLVLVDGVRVNDPASGALDWGALAPANIERVEILRGPQSTLFGADAAGGVVQIFTRKSEGARRFALQLGAGTERDATGSLHFRAGAADGVRAAASFSHQKVDAISAYRRSGGVRLPRGEGEVDGWRSSTAQGEISLPLGALRGTLRARALRDAADYDGGFPVDPDDASRRQKTRDEQVSWQLDFPSLREVQSRLLLSHKRARRVDFPAATPARTRSTQANFDAEYAARERRVVAGLDFEELEIRTAATRARANRAAGFVRGEFSFARFGFDAGVRHERHSRAGSSSTWQLGARYNVSERVQLVATAGSAFHAPTLTDLFLPIYGNPALRPERSRGFDAGFRTRGKVAAASAQLEVRYFRQRYKNGIGYDGQTFASINVDRALYDGVELSGQLAWGDFFLEWQHTELDASATETPSSSGLLLRRGDTSALSAGFARGALSGRAEWRYTGARRDFGGALPSHATLALQLGAQLSERGNISLRVNNVLNEDYEEIYGYGTLGRNARLSWRYEF